MIAFLCGLATLIRPTEIVSILFPILYGIHNKESLRYKLNLLGKNWVYLLLGVIVFFIPIIPQLFYWKYITGNWIFYSYGSEESFFFGQPKIMHVLFSYRKGLLIYTPIISFALIGFYFMKHKLKAQIIPTSIIFCVSLFLVSSWWCWWFGGAFGHRAFVEYLPLMAIPLAGFIHHLKGWHIRWKFPMVFAMLIFIYMSLKMTFIYSSPWDGPDWYWDDYFRILRRIF